MRIIRISQSDEINRNDIVVAHRWLKAPSNTPGQEKEYVVTIHSKFDEEPPLYIVSAWNGNTRRAALTRQPKISTNRWSDAVNAYNRALESKLGRYGDFDAPPDTYAGSKYPGENASIVTRTPVTSHEPPPFLDSMERTIERMDRGSRGGRDGHDEYNDDDDQLRATLLEELMSELNKDNLDGHTQGFWNYILRESYERDPERIESLRNDLDEDEFLREAKSNALADLEYDIFAGNYDDHINFYSQEVDIYGLMAEEGIGMGRESTVPTSTLGELVAMVTLNSDYSLENFKQDVEEKEMYPQIIEAIESDEVSGPNHIGSNLLLFGSLDEDFQGWLPTESLMTRFREASEEDEMASIIGQFYDVPEESLRARLSESGGKVPMAVAWRTDIPELLLSRLQEAGSRKERSQLINKILENESVSQDNKNVYYMMIGQHYNIVDEEDEYEDDDIYDFNPLASSLSWYKRSQKQVN
jgi:hypothetical protein